MGAIFTNIAEIFANSGWAQIFFAEGGWKYAVMIGVACVLLYPVSYTHLTLPTNREV